MKTIIVALICATTLFLGTITPTHADVWAERIALAEKAVTGVHWVPVGTIFRPGMSLAVEFGTKPIWAHDQRAWLWQRTTPSVRPNVHAVAALFIDCENGVTALFPDLGNMRALIGGVIWSRDHHKGIFEYERGIWSYLSPVERGSTSQFAYQLVCEGRL